MSPLAPGQWKGFLAVYAGFYVFNNFIRPFRMALSIGLSKYFEMSIEAVQNKTNLSRGLATFVVVFLYNIVGTCCKFYQNSNHFKLTDIPNSHIFFLS